MNNVYSELEYPIFITKEQFANSYDKIIHNNVLTLIHILDNQNINYSIIDGQYNKQKQTLFVIVLYEEDYIKFKDTEFSNIIVNIKDV